VNYDLSPKEQVLAMLVDVPDDVGFEEIQDDIYLLARLNIAERDSREGRVRTQAEMEEWVKQWQTALEQERA
jgi:anti-sigma-K factor RskA